MVFRFPDIIGRLPCGSDTNVLVIFINSGYIYRLPANLDDIKSEEEKEDLITAYPAEVKEGNYYRRSK